MQNCKNIINLLAWGANEAIDKVLMGKMLNEDEVELIEPISLGVKLKIIKKRRWLCAAPPSQRSMENSTKVKS